MTTITAFQPDAFQNDAFQIAANVADSQSAGNNGGPRRPVPQTRYIDYVGYVRNEKPLSKRRRKKVRKLKTLYHQHISESSSSLSGSGAKVIAGIVGNYIPQEVWQENVVSQKVLPAFERIDFESLSTNVRDFERLHKALVRTPPVALPQEDDDDMLMAMLTTLLMTGEELCLGG